MSYAQRELINLVEAVALGLRDPANNYVLKKDVTAEVERRLLVETHPAVMAEIIRSVSQSTTTRFFNGRKPKFSDQGGLYFPGFWLPLGGGKRVLMADATDADLLAYADGVEDNRKKINEAADRTGDYVRERMSAWGRHPGKLLHWVEVHEFGYEPTEQDPEEYFSDDEELD